MSTIQSLIGNYMLVCAIIAWAAAQLAKCIVKWIAMRKFDPERLVGAGGMPSAHTAMVCSLALAAVRSVGPGSPIFAVCFMFACVVIYDAMGVRRAAGEHAKRLNQMSDAIELEEDGEEAAELQEKLGHTPLEVLGGALLGILVPMIIV